MPNFYQLVGIAFMVPIVLLLLLLVIALLYRFIKDTWFKIKAMPQTIKTMDKTDLLLHIIIILFIVGLLIYAWGRAVEKVYGV